MQAVRPSTTSVAFYAKSHDPNRLDPRLAALRVKTNCPACKKHGLYTLETRATTKAGALRRRRKRCNYCGYRITTYEVNAEWFESARQLMAVVDRLAGGRPKPDAIPCRSCVHNTRKDCGYGVPEFMTNEAHDCLYFNPK